MLISLSKSNKNSKYSQKKKQMRTPFGATSRLSFGPSNRVKKLSESSTPAKIWPVVHGRTGEGCECGRRMICDLKKEISFIVNRRNWERQTKNATRKTVIFTAFSSPGHKNAN